MNDKENDNKQNQGADAEAKRAQERAQARTKLHARQILINNHIQSQNKTWGHILEEMTTAAMVDEQFLKSMGADKMHKLTPNQRQSSYDFRRELLDEIAEKWDYVPRSVFIGIREELLIAGLPDRDIKISFRELRDLAKRANMIETLAGLLVDCADQGATIDSDTYAELLRMILLLMERIRWIAETRLDTADETDAEENPGE